MKITLFDWVGGGHHPIYMRRFAEALASEADVVLAAPDETLHELGARSVTAISLGRPRPHMPSARRLSPSVRSVLLEEISLLERVARQSRPHHLVHLYADPVLPYLIRRPVLDASVSLLCFYPRAHYPAAFQTPLGMSERVRATAKELLIARWRRRADAHALLTLDEEAARRWRLRPGAPAHWVPEPPVPRLAEPVDDLERTGVIVYGALAERKGIDLLARAVAAAPVSLHVTIAGEAYAPFLPRLEELVAEMRRAGATVDVHARHHSETDGLRALARANCAVLSYPWHDGMSRVLVEACSVGTPVVVHDRGLVGYLVQHHGLGHAVDCQDAGALRRAILDLAGGAAAVRYRDKLARFASQFSPELFHRELVSVFREGDGAHVPHLRSAPTPIEGRP